MDNRKLETGNWKLETGSPALLAGWLPEAETGNRKLETGNSKLETGSPALPADRLPEAETGNRKLETGNSKLETGSPALLADRLPEAETGNSKLETRNPALPAGRLPEAETGNRKLETGNLPAQAGSELVPRLTSRQLQFLLRVTPAALASEREYGIPACITIAQAILESATAAGWGTSRLFVEANNPFGIKYCHFGEKASLVPGPLSLVNKGQVTKDKGQPSEDYGFFDAATWEIENGQRKEILAQFQRFPNLTEAFRAHSLLLARTPRYAPAMAVLKSTDYADHADSGEKKSVESVKSADWKAFAERLGPRASANDSEHCGYSTNPSYSATLIKLVEESRLHDPRAQQWYATGRDPGPA
jgi:flagellum-specific peptidoglycan hydrolase FlgJ